MGALPKRARISSSISTSEAEKTSDVKKVR
jgi:hypothetical protein